MNRGACGAHHPLTAIKPQQKNKRQWDEVDPKSWKHKGNQTFLFVHRSMWSDSGLSHQQDFFATRMSTSEILLPVHDASSPVSQSLIARNQIPHHHELTRVFNSWYIFTKSVFTLWLYLRPADGATPHLFTQKQVEFQMHSADPGTAPATVTLITLSFCVQNIHVIQKMKKSETVLTSSREAALVIICLRYLSFGAEIVKILWGAEWNFALWENPLTFNCVSGHDGLVPVLCHWDCEWKHSVWVMLPEQCLCFLFSFAHLSSRCFFPRHTLCFVFNNRLMFIVFTLTWLSCRTLKLDLTDEENPAPNLQWRVGCVYFTVALLTWHFDFDLSLLDILLIHPLWSSQSVRNSYMCV